MPANTHEQHESHADHVRQCLDRANAQSGRADVALIARRDAAAMIEATALDDLARSGCPEATLAGRTLAVKACFDVAGWVTHAGSRVLAEQPAAVADAPIVAALRHAGAVVIAQSNMTEFAYGALGLNDTFGTPTTPLYPNKQRVSGGSTSGGAVAVALGIADIALGSDTSGSARIPAAFCGVAGFKPSIGRYREEGMVHLAPTFDVPGIVAASARICREVDAALTHRDVERSEEPISVRGLRFIVPDDLTVDGVDLSIVDAFEDWIDELVRNGAHVTSAPMVCLSESAIAAREGGIIPAEAFMLHRERLQASADLYDPRVGTRIAAGAEVRAHDYAAGLRRLRLLAQQYDHEMADADAVLTPTVPILPPLISDLQTAEEYLATNAQAFRLTEYANRLWLPSISIPGDLANRRPIGLLITGRRGDDERLLDAAVQVERCLSKH